MMDCELHFHSSPRKEWPNPTAGRSGAVKPESERAAAAWAAAEWVAPWMAAAEPRSTRAEEENCPGLPLGSVPVADLTSVAARSATPPGSMQRHCAQIDRHIQ